MLTVPAALAVTATGMTSRPGGPDTTQEHSP